jgi:hypothetical protein
MVRVEEWGRPAIAVKGETPVPAESLRELGTKDALPPRFPGGAWGNAGVEKANTKPEE